MKNSMKSEIRLKFEIILGTELLQTFHCWEFIGGSKMGINWGVEKLELIRGLIKWELVGRLIKWELIKGLIN